MRFFPDKKKKNSELFQDDYSLWQFLKYGNPNSLKELYFRYYNELYQYGLRITNNPSITKEAIQDLFVYIWEKHATLNDVRCVKSYLFRSFRNSLLKQDTTKLSFIEDYELVEKSFCDVSKEGLIMNNENNEELKTRVQKSLNKLSKNQKEIILLKFFHKLSYFEIAELLDIEYQSVRNSISRAFKVLRKHIEK